MQMMETRKGRKEERKNEIAKQDLILTAPNLESEPYCSYSMTSKCLFPSQECLGGRLKSMADWLSLQG